VFATPAKSGQDKSCEIGYPDTLFWPAFCSRTSLNIGGRNKATSPVFPDNSSGLITLVIHVLYETVSAIDGPMKEANFPGIILPDLAKRDDGNVHEKEIMMIQTLLSSRLLPPLSTCPSDSLHTQGSNRRRINSSLAVC
jgi:hypothetical protein